MTQTEYTLEEAQIAQFSRSIGIVELKYQSRRLERVRIGICTNCV